MDGFSVSEQTDEEAVTVWTGSSEDKEDRKRGEMDLETSKYVLKLIGDNFCQLVKTENTAITWVKKDSTSASVRVCLYALVPCDFIFFTLPRCLLSLQLRSCGSEQWEEWGRCVMHAKPLSSTCTGRVTSVALWCAWTVTKPARRKKPKVSHTLQIL